MFCWIRRYALLLWGPGILLGLPAYAQNSPAPSSPSLLSQAHRVLNLMKPNGEWNYWVLGPYTRTLWLSDHELFLFKFDPKTQWLLAIYNLSTGKIQTLPGLSRKMTYSVGRVHVTLSPDRKRALWILPGTDTSELVYGRSDGSHALTIFSRDLQAGNACWLSDSRSWITFKPKYNSLRGVSNPLQAESFHPDTSDTVSSKPLTIPKEFEIVEPYTVYVTTEDHAIGYPYYRDSKPPSSLNLHEFDIRHPERPEHFYTLRFPEGTHLKELSISPSGERVAWLLTSADSTPGHTLLQVYVSLLDGSQMHILGQISVPKSDAWDMYEVEQNQPTLLPWMPDNRRITFLYKDALWTVSAE